MDFDLIVHEGRLLLVGSPDRSHLACTWDPASDRWTEYRLENAEDAGDYTELASLAAAVVDGRIVIGGGGDHHGFAMWELESGKVRSSAWEGGVWSAVRAEWGGRPMFVVGGSSNTNVELWDPSLTEANDDGAVTRPLEGMVEVGDLFASSGASSAVAVGTLGGRPMLIANAHAGGAVVWDVEDQRPLVEFDCEPFGERVNLAYQADNEVHEVRIADLEGSPVVLTAQKDDTVRIWELPAAA